ncbi:hypothetical protein H8B02_20435 [Bradyrhizobium sp. Pear77]|uniref:hypothetical protein n=1 Tax=Bradyrhizobium altum TaxID=1571202 RepID=UPI001E473C10|nr:hypothetical protein [Bradyrhizobium altum]MCC8955712.1 hypothetical protein [Bradyrhizobium altum]
MITLSGNSDEVEWQLRYCRRRYLVTRELGGDIGKIWLGARFRHINARQITRRADPNQSERLRASALDRELPSMVGELLEG